MPNNLVEQITPWSLSILKLERKTFWQERLITQFPLLDAPFLKTALEEAEDFLKQVNEKIRSKENHERFDWMQKYIQTDFSIDFDSCTNKLGPRKLLHFGYLTKVRAICKKFNDTCGNNNFIFQVKSGKELLGFLLNDFLLLVQPSKSIASTQFTFQRNNNVTYKVYKQVKLFYTSTKAVTLLWSI